MAFSRSLVNYLMILSVASVLALGCGKTEPPKVQLKAGGGTAKVEAKQPAGITLARADLKPAPTGTADNQAVWGNLSGTFIYYGDAPEQEKLDISQGPEKDKAICANHHPLDESLIVNKENGGLENVLISIYLGRKSTAPEVHPSYDKTAGDVVTLDNALCRFAPHVVLLRTSQTLKIRNSDKVGHNTNIKLFANPAFNELTPPGQATERQFSASERSPATVGCNVHPWMKAWVVVQEHPYFTVSGKDGKFEIPNLPVGKWTFRVWHEKSRDKSKSISQAIVNQQKVSWKKGRFTYEIKSGDNDLGEIKLSPELFQ